MRMIESLARHLQTQARALEPTGYPVLPCPVFPCVASGLQFLDKSSCLTPRGFSAPAQKEPPVSAGEGSLGEEAWD